MAAYAPQRPNDRDLTADTAAGYLNDGSNRASKPHTRKAQVAAASGLLLLSVFGLVLSGWASVSQGTTHHTVVEIPRQPATYPADQVAAAQEKACSAWDRAAVTMATAANAAADTPVGWDNPLRQKARGNEIRVALTQIALVRDNIDPATPPNVRGAIEAFFSQTLAIENAALHRQGPAEDALIDQQNAFVDHVESVCRSK